MVVLGLILYYALFAFSLALWGRLIVDLVQVINPTWRPSGVVLVLVELVFTITDPVLKFLRRLIPPLRLGAVAIDLAWMVAMLATQIGMTFAARMG